ncbi:MAG: radical SAM protein [Nitrospinae bacterium]|nr:radical SAM protein [Nitrospinota bacterium]
MTVNKEEYDAPLAFPERVTLELTNACNLRCGFCPRRLMTARLGFMDMGLYKKAIDEMASMRPVGLIPFFRGEPLIHPEFLEMMFYAKQRGLGPVQLVSNAMLLDERKGRGIIESGVDFISFSMDTVNAADYETSRIKARYDVAAGNILRFIELKKGMGSKTPEIQISSVQTDIARPYKDRFVEFWLERADKVRLFVEHSKDGSFGSLGSGLGLPDFPRRLPCGKVMREMVVYWDGQVALCNHDWDRKDRIGDINTSSILDIWNGPSYRDIRRAHVAGDVHDPACAGCDHWKMYYVEEKMVGEVYSRR